MMKSTLVALIFVFYHSTVILAQVTNVRTWESVLILPHTPIKNQAMSGTCWSFATLSWLESEHLRQHPNDRLDLSEMYVARYAYLLKVQRYLEKQGQGFFTAGGQAHDVLRVIERYGLVPEASYTGLVRDQRHHNHRELDTLMWERTCTLLNAKSASLAPTDRHIYEAILDQELGQPPSYFEYAGQQYTPKSFAQNYLGFEPSRYLSLCSQADFPYYQEVVLTDKFNWMDASYYNLPLEAWHAAIDSALARGYTLVWNGDVSASSFDYPRGVAYLSEDLLPVSAQSRQQALLSGSTKIDHLMHIVGKAYGNDGQPYYLIKNSWGRSNARLGYLYMSVPYLLLKTVSVTLNKEAIPEYNVK
jgi:bleomycin hydrolase